MRLAGTLRTAFDRAAAAAFYAMIAITVAFLVVPVLVAAILSFDDRQFLGAFPPSRWSLRWYQRFFDNPAYLDGLVVSLELAVIATAISTVAGTAAAVVLARGGWRGRTAVGTLLLSPKFVPTVVIGFSLLGLAAAAHIFDAFTRLVIGHIIITLPFTVRATLASLAGIRPNLVEAAVSLGATPRRAFFDVTLPLARTGIMAGAMMAFALSFDEVAVSLFLADPFTQTLPIVLVAEMRTNLNLTVAAFASVFSALTVLIVLLLARTIGLDAVVGKGMYR